MVGWWCGVETFIDKIWVWAAAERCQSNNTPAVCVHGIGATGSRCWLGKVSGRRGVDVALSRVRSSWSVAGEAFFYYSEDVRAIGGITPRWLAHNANLV